MTAALSLAVDAMSGDNGPATAIDAVAEFLREHKHVRVLVYGQSDILTPLLSPHQQTFGERLVLKHAEQVVDMHDKPRDAIRQKKQSSMRLAINAVRDGEADACVSAGNTGALMATSKLVLKTIVGISRPAIMASMPSRGEPGRTWLLDMGANAECTPEQLQEFAVMGSIFVKEVMGIKKPRVGLLNIGEEAMKGPDGIQLASQLLSEAPIHYLGFAEGNDVFSGKFDVIVTDGFTGNVALKTCEGTAKFISDTIKELIGRSWLSKCLGLLALPTLKALSKRMDPSEYNGAGFIGLRAPVIKSHGGVNVLGFKRALEVALTVAEHKVPEVMAQSLAELH